MTDVDDFIRACDDARATPDVDLAAVDRLIAAFYDMPGNSVGGVLHVVLEDTNLSSDSIRNCIADAEREGDAAGAALGRLLLAIPPLRRLELASLCKCGCADEERELLARDTG